MIEPKAESFEIPFFFEEKQEKCVLAVVRAIDFCPGDWEKYLSVAESERLRSISCEKVKIQYCLGRAAAKKALGLLVGEMAYRDINIRNEKSGRPIIESTDYSVSIAHTDEIAAGLVYRNEFSFGIDIEKIRKNRRAALERAVSGGGLTPVNDLRSLTVVWSLKEALSKALKCGFRLSFEEFEPAGLSGNEEFFACSYARHPEFGGLATVCGENVFAAAFPSILFPHPPTPDFLSRHPGAVKFRRAMLAAGG
jgi:phosphopantetheinyl transferase (holo-ACP synthase)